MPVPLVAPRYYALAHFTKYVVPGSVRIDLQSTSTGINVPMEAGAFLRPDGLVALVVLNRGAHLAGDASTAADSTTAYAVQAPGGNWINMNVPHNSMQTILLAST